MVGALSIVTVACGSSGGGSSTGSSSKGGQEKEEATAGGKLVFGHDISLTGLDPASATGASNGHGTGAYSAAIFDMLAYVEPDTFDVAMGTAESIESEDGTVWTVKIKDGIEFSDGTPYDAEAVKYTWEKIADPANKSANAGLAQTIGSMEATDPLTLEVTLTAPNAQFDRLVANQLPFIGSPTAWESLGSAFAEKPVGAGPFVVESWVRDSALKLVKNQNYWVDGRPLLDELEIRYLEDPTQRYNAFQADQLDVAYLHSEARMIPIAQSAGYEILRPDVPGGLTLMFNTVKPPFDDPVARKAIALAIDRDGVNNVVNSGAAPLGETIYPEAHPFYDPEAVLAVKDADAAQALLDQYAEEHGSPLSFTMMTSDTQQPTLEYLQAQLTSDFDNLEIEVKMQPGTQVVESALAGDFQATFFTVNLSDPEPDISNFLSSEGGRNYMSYDNPELDAAISAGRDSIEVEDRAAAYADAQRIILDDVPLTFVSPMQFIYVVNSKVQNLQMYNSGIPRWADVGVGG